MVAPRDLPRGGASGWGGVLVLVQGALRVVGVGPCAARWGVCRRGSRCWRRVEGRCGECWAVRSGMGVFVLSVAREGCERGVKGRVRVLTGEGELHARRSDVRATEPHVAMTWRRGRASWWRCGHNGAARRRDLATTTGPRVVAVGQKVVGGGHDKWRRLCSQAKDLLGLRNFEIRNEK